FNEKDFTIVGLSGKISQFDRLSCRTQVNVSQKRLVLSTAGLHHGGSPFAVGTGSTGKDLIGTSRSQGEVNHRKRREHGNEHERKGERAFDHLFGEGIQR